MNLYVVSRHQLCVCVVYKAYPYIVEYFASDDDDHDHDHDHAAIRRTKYATASGPEINDWSPISKPTAAPTDNLAIGLSIAVAILALVFAGVLAFYIYLRRSHIRLRGSRGDIQELTTHAHMNRDAEAVPNGIAHEESGSPVQVQLPSFLIFGSSIAILFFIFFSCQTG